MAEVALNVPFEAQEIIKIVADELQARMSGLTPLHGSKEYAAFKVDFQVKIRLRRAGESDLSARETLAWGSVQDGQMPSAEDLDAVSEEITAAELTSGFESGDPNEERMKRDMPLTVETPDGKGGKTRKKVRVKA